MNIQRKVRKKRRDHPWSQGIIFSSHFDKIWCHAQKLSFCFSSPEFRPTALKKRRFLRSPFLDCVAVSLACRERAPWSRCCAVTYSHFVKHSAFQYPSSKSWKSFLKLLWIFIQLYKLQIEKIFCFRFSRIYPEQQTIHVKNLVCPTK